MLTPPWRLLDSCWGSALVWGAFLLPLGVLGKINKDPTRADEEPEKYNLLIIPLIAFGAFVVFLCMRCCHWNQKDFRDRGIIIEHHHRKKNIAKGLIRTRFDGQSQRRLSCVPEQLMLLPLFLTGSARSDLDKVMDPPRDSIVEKICHSDSECSSEASSEPPSSDSEFDTPFPYHSPNRRRSSSVPPEYLKGRKKSSRSSSIIDMNKARRVSVVSAVSTKSAQQAANPNYNPNLLSVTAELHEPPRLASGEETPQSVVCPLPSEAAGIRITRDVYVETKYREVGVDTSDLYPQCLPVTQVNQNLFVIQHRKFARVRRSDDEPSRKRRREETVSFLVKECENIMTPSVHPANSKPVHKQPSCDKTSSQNSSGHSFAESVLLNLPPLSPISANSEFYRRLCSSEDSALAKSPISELSAEDRSTRDPMSRDGTLSPPSLPKHSKSEEDKLSRVDSGKYSDTSSRRGRQSEPRSPLPSVSSECDDPYSPLLE